MAWLGGSDVNYILRGGTKWDNLLGWLERYYAEDIPGVSRLAGSAVDASDEARKVVARAFPIVDVLRENPVP